MRREPDHFDDEPLVLLYIAKKLNESLAVEKLLEDAEIDYLVEVDTYVGGIVFRSERAGAFFYVTESHRETAVALLKQNGYRPQEELA